MARPRRSFPVPASPPLAASAVHTHTARFTAEQVKANGFQPGTSYTMEIEAGGMLHTHTGCTAEYHADGSAAFRLGRDTYAGSRKLGEPRVAGLRNRLARQSNGAPEG